MPRTTKRKLDEVKLARLRELTGFALDGEGVLHPDLVEMAQLTEWLLRSIGRWKEDGA